MKITKKRLALALLALVVALPGLAVAVSPFVDVAPGKFYEAPVNWAFNNGITTGKDSTHFDPNGAVTRGESVTFLKRYHDNVVKQSVGALGCSTDQVAFHNGSSWVCGSVRSDYRLTPTARNLVDSGGNVGLYSAAVYGADGLPFVSYYDTTKGDLKVMVCGVQDCFFQAIRTLDGTTAGPIVGRYSSIAVRSDGIPVVAYFDSTNISLKLAVCNVSDCSTGAAIRTLNSPGQGGQFVSMAIGSTGNPIMSYWNVGAGALEIYSCNNSSCTSGNLRTVDSGGNVGEYTSIGVGPSGNPVVSYYDRTNGDLKLYECTAADCSSGAARSLATNHNVGTDTSLAVASSGDVIISYYDVTTADLMVEHLDSHLVGVSIG